MDNATIHIHGNSRVIKDMLWETMVDGLPLHVLLIYLPTRSPELNPIFKLIFHILVMKILLYWYRIARPCNNAILHKAAQVMNEMLYALILCCCAHCGY
jgi:hypothetical protein